MGLILIDNENEKIPQIQFFDLDMDNDMEIRFSFKDSNKKCISAYITRSQVEALKRHVDSELNKL